MLDFIAVDFPFTQCEVECISKVQHILGTNQGFANNADRAHYHQIALIVILIHGLQNRFVKLLERIFLDFNFEFSCFKITT